MTAQNEKKFSFKMVLLTQSMVFLYSVISMLSKVSSGIMVEYGIFSIQFICLFGTMVGGLGVYAILWQKVLTRIDLLTAYVNKSTTLIWSLLWSVAIFKETVAWNNIVGIIIIVMGIILVTKDD